MMRIFSKNAVAGLSLLLGGCASGGYTVATVPGSDGGATAVFLNTGSGDVTVCDVNIYDAECGDTFTLPAAGD